MVEKVLWDIEARIFLKEAISLIKKGSELNAEKVKKVILRSTSDLKRNPRRHPPDTNIKQTIMATIALMKCTVLE